MNWYIGQPIVAIKSHSQGDFSKGDTFNIVDLRLSPCSCKKVQIDIGVINNTGGMHCTSCGHNDTACGKNSYYADNIFAPLDQDISELTEILSNPHKQGLTIK